MTSDTTVVQLSDHRPRTRPVLPEPMPTPWESARQLGTALRTFAREVRAYAANWLSWRKIGFTERANFDGYAAGYCDGVSARPHRSA